MLIKRNSPEFKTLRSLVGDYAGEAGRRRWILLYALKPYQKLEEALLINTQKSNVAVLYELAYESLQAYLYDAGKTLHYDEALGRYYFKSSPASRWHQVPFALAGKLRKQVMAQRPGAAKVTKVASMPVKKKAPLRVVKASAKKKKKK